MIRVEYILLFRGDRIEGIILQPIVLKSEHWDFANKAGPVAPRKFSLYLNHLLWSTGKIPIVIVEDPSVMMNRQFAIKAALLRSPSQRIQSRTFTAFPAIHAPPPPDGPSLVKSFLYGSEKGQELQREMEQSYSKVLARGKYVHKMTQHHVKPDKINEYVALMSFPHKLYTDFSVVPKYSPRLLMIPKIKFI